MTAIRRLLSRDRGFAYAGLGLALAVTATSAYIVLGDARRLSAEETEAEARRWAMTIAETRAGTSADATEKAGALADAAVKGGEARRVRLIGRNGTVERASGAAADDGVAAGNIVSLPEAVLAGETVTEAAGAGTVRLLVPVKDAGGTVTGAAEIVSDIGEREGRYMQGAIRLLSGLLALVLGGLLILVLALFARAREKKTADERLLYLTRHDALTELPNRDMIQEALGTEIERHVTDGRQLAFHVVDIDNFKAINETFGLGAADTVLREIGSRLSKLVTDPRHVARLGSDEFAVIQPEAGGARHAEIFAGRIAAAVAQPISTAEHEIATTASIGIALVPDHGRDVRRVMTAADAAMAAVKASGFNDMRFFRPSMERSSALRFELRGELREAFDKRWFEIAYQPQYDLKERRLIGFEALMRLRHPRRGFVSPADFLPVADELGLVSALNDWIIKESCRAARDWPEGMGVTVNLSASQFKKKDGAQRILELCQEAYCPPKRLALDLTESILDLPGERVHDEMRRLKDAGVLLVHDDFGTGTSSVTNLFHYGFDGFKLDGDLVRGIGVEPSAAVIVKALVQLAGALEMTVMAESVETVEQAGFLVRNGCSIVQGFLFGRPVPLSEVDAVIAKEHVRAAA